MTPLSLAILIILIFALLETPLFTILAALSLACLYMVDADWQALQTILIEMNRLASMPVLLALPLFTLAGNILTETQAPKRILACFQTLLGWVPGGLAIAVIGSCAFFTALTGASGMTIVALGSLLYPILKEEGYSEHFSLGLLTTSGSLGLLFPPSLAIILYGVVANLSIAELFKAALLPGGLLILALSLFAIIYHRRIADYSGHSPHRRTSWPLIRSAFIAAKWDWPIVIILVVGVYGGFVTIAEVSAMVLVYVIVVECFLLKEVNLKDQLPQMMVDSAMLSGAIIVILGMALGFTGYLVDEQIPNRILNSLSFISANKYFFLFFLNVFLLAAGCVMDIFSAIMIIVPIVAPIAMEYGIDPLHLGVIFLVNLEIGYSTPPVGINLFVASLKFGKPVTVLYRASLPYLFILLIMLILVTYIPALSTILLGS